MSEPTLRPATGADLAQVADLWHAGWHDAHPGHVPDGLTAGRTLSSFHERAAGRASDTTVAEADGVVVGFVMVVDDEVEQLYVGPVARGTGLAARLLTDAEQRVAAGGHVVAWLAVVTGNARARRFYARRGWADEGDLPYEVTAGGTTYVSPCRRYTTRVR